MVFISSLSARIANRLGLLNIFRIGYRKDILKSKFKIPILENREGFPYHLVMTEPYLLSVFQKLYEVNDFLFLDVGVNFGQTLLKLKAVNLEASYIGIEPSGLCSYYASHLIKINQMPNSRVIQCALSNESKLLTLYAQSEGDTSASILEHFIDKQRITYNEIVPAVTLDQLIPIVRSTGKEVILKVDVEGAEWLVFQGGKLFISEFRPVILFENLSFGEDESRKQNQRSISKFLDYMEFDLYLLNESTARPEKLELINNKNDEGRSNYLAVPREKVSLFSNFLMPGISTHRSTFVQVTDDINR